VSATTGGRPDATAGRVRDLRARDVPRLAELLRTEFPEEEQLLGTRPEGVVEIARRFFRWDTQLVLGVLRLVGASPARFLAVEADGRLVATTLVSFPARAGFLSMVMVDPAYRRRGYARRLLRAAHALAARRHRAHVALDVLETNGPARALYASLGYRPLRAFAYYTRDLPATSDEPPAEGPVRPLAPRDASALARLANRALPAEVEEVLPVRAGDLLGSRWANRALAASTAAWVVDRGGGAEAHVSASVGPATTSGHLSTPIVGAAVPADAQRELLAQALAWLAERGVPRVLSRAADDDLTARAALEAAGFRPELRLLTLARASA
jgi:ribosomal protein S18 acetylase RimI-like enzyme